MKSSTNSEQGPKMINIKSTQQQQTDQNELILEKQK